MDPFTRIPFPLRGVDRSTPAAKPPDLTCPDALNVRGFSPASERLGGGTRSGYTKGVNAQAGAPSYRRINRAVFVPRTQIATPTSSGALQSVVDTFSGLERDANADFGGDYVVIEKRSGSTGLVGQQYSSQAVYNVTTASEFTPGIALYGNSRSSSSSAQGAKILAVMFKTSNDMKVSFAADFKATADNSSTGTTATDQPTYLGACVRASDNFQNFIVAYLAFVTTNTMQLCIDKHESSGGVATVTRLKTSTQTIALSNRARRAGDPWFSIRLSVVNNVLTATASCSLMRPTTDTITIDAFTTFSTNSRAGVWMGMGDNGVSYSGRRWINQLEYKRYVPTEVTTIAELLGSQYPGTTAVPATDYFIPSGFKAVRSAGNTLATATAEVTGPSNNAAQTLGSAQTQASIKNDTNKIIGVAGATGAASTMLVQTLASTSTSQCMEIRFDASITDPATQADTVTPCFRVVDLGGGSWSFIRTHWTREISASSAESSQSWLKTISFSRMLVGNTAEAYTAEPTIGYGTSETPAPVFPLRAPMRWVMNANGTVTIIVNDLVLYTSNYANTALNTSAVRVGAEFHGPGAVVSNSVGFRIVVPNSVAVTSVSAGSDILAFTPGPSTGSVYVADFAALNAWASTVGTGPTGANIEYGILNNKLYVVDGFAGFVVDPITKTIIPWTAKFGTIPSAMKLACTYRGRLILANQASNTAIWYASRINDPLDFDFGATDLSAKAIVGTNATVGAPPDPITCLIPFSDDYLLFGCLSQIWILQGDPGAGGSIQNVSFQTGILGSRAYCFDDAGNLYFMGTGGLFVMARTTREFKNLGGRRLATLLDRVDATANLVQLAFDPLRQTVHIFITPNQTPEGSTQTVGTHVVFDPALDAFWLDQFPSTFGPFSVMQTAGPTPEDRRYWIGCNDGYLRKPTESATDDDGTAIVSQVRFAPIEFGDGQLESIASEIQATGGVETGTQGSALNNGPLTWYWYAARSCAEVSVVDPTTGTSGTWFNTTADGDLVPGDGYQTPVGLRVTGGAHQLFVKATSGRWTLEQVSALITPTGRKRR